MHLDLLILAPIGSILALSFAGYLVMKILKTSEGTSEMIAIAEAVREGSYAYLKRQYSGVAIFFGAMFLVLIGLALAGKLPIFVPFAFLTGGFFSGLAGFIGMSIATRSSARTTNAAKSSLNAGLNIAFSSGAVMGLVVVGLGLLDLSIWYYFLDWWYSSHATPLGMDKLGAITSTMLCFGMGASSQALFARVGGGIFTKAADVGADLVGKVEAGIPEDDPRNPAVIADNVGDNVGDVAGMGADLYESYVGSIVATAALGVAAFGRLGLGLQSVTIPMVMAAVGVMASIIGTFFVKTKEKACQGTLLTALRRGVFSSSIIVAIVSFFVVKYILGMQYIGVYWAVLSGLVAGVLIGLSTEYFTSSKYKPTQAVAASSLTGPATVIISGMSVGMLSTAVPVLVVSAAIMASYYFAGGAANAALGLYGVAISAVGMLSTLGITLATDAYGPVADNAGGNAEMTHQPKEVRQRTDALDSLGNTTAATGKGFAIGSAALTALALIAAYRDQILIMGGNVNLSMMNPKTLIGLLIGGMLPFVFCSLTMSAVGRAAGAIVVEVRRQFKEIAGIMEGRTKPDYARCVNIVTRSAQKEMILPSVLAIAAPIVVGIVVGVDSVIGMLVGATVTGFVLAIMMANSGGSWDNAKKYIEEGNFGGKGSIAHKAGVVGDTVGDPFKDTSGPSLNILIKLMSMVSIVFASFIMSYTLMK
ncbi:MAG: sodium-translocating pyrophosphatase [Candidatus Omnitrophica bacterium]|nr:sodium-translocating pyrophosphatase [Candidatus Omnitrophota bacterium]MBU1038503.1 sodium-translocating pyrophosphatase [Candidatus Omnitrophota bacterium]MBU1808602.1 sodium-translocating pyrophosphatase [Candidatus Omnitrophota bacterium]